MQIYRRHYLALADMNDQAFRSLARRNQVPRLAGSPSERIWNQGGGADDEERDAFGYHPLEAIMLAIADMLVRQAATSRDAAKIAVESWPQFAADAVRRVEKGESIYACFFTLAGSAGRVVTTEGDEREKVPSFLGVDTLGSLTARLENMSETRSGTIGCAIFLNLTPAISRASAIFRQLRDGKSLTEAMEQ